ncbi:MAG: hypothetical protein KGM44_11880 [bacterium]|nr:hypothetical protein [bacterium]
MMNAAAVMLLAALAALAAAPVAASAQPCRAQTLSIQGEGVKSTFCVVGVERSKTGGGDVAHVSISESLAGPGGTLQRTVSKDVLLAGQDGRLSDDIPLRSLGIEKTLHVTFVFRNGVVTPESALLIPGAIPVL